MTGGHLNRVVSTAERTLTRKSALSDKIQEVCQRVDDEVKFRLYRLPTFLFYGNNKGLRFIILKIICYGVVVTQYRLQFCFLKGSMTA
jgi:hypothetical protein